jgi:hypothetical protein
MILDKDIASIIDEIGLEEVSYMDITKVKYKWHPLSSIEPEMDDSDYESLKNDIKMIGKVHTPVLIYENMVLDGRHRQKACIELGFEMPIKNLSDKKYNKTKLSEVVRSIHMNRSKSKTQKEIQAFDRKKQIANVSWAEAAEKFGVNERAIKRVNTLYNELSKSGYVTDFDKVKDTFWKKKNVLPKDFEWLSKSTGTFSGCLRQLREFVSENIPEPESIDITEVDPVTGEFISKEANPYIEELKTKDQIIKELQEEVDRLKQQLTK